MKKYLAHILVFSLFAIIVVASVGGLPHIVQAEIVDPPKAGTGVVSGGDGLFGFARDVISWIISPIAVFALGLASLVTMLSGVLLNYAVNVTVVDMAKNFGNLPAINQAWTAIRDIANMGFIFVLLFAAIQMIVGTGKNLRQLIVNMIIAALLINFSLFFTKVVIDAANLLALTFYEAIVPGALAAGTGLTKAGLSNTITDLLGVTTLFKAAGTLDISTLATVGVMGTIVLLVSAFVFAAIALLLVIRYVVLIFVLILSPLYFVAMIVPGLEPYKKKWYDALIGQAFFAPIYFLLTWITIVVLRGITANGTHDFAAAFVGTTGANGANTFSPSAIPTILDFLVVIIFLIVSLTVAKDWANKAGGTVSSFTKMALGYAGGATLGLTGRIGRGTVGRLGQTVADSERLKEASEAGGLSGAGARLALLAGQKTAQRSFDLRGTVLGDELGGGKAKKGGFVQDVKDKNKREKEFADSLKPSDLVVARASKELDDAKKTGDGTKIREAQAGVDKLRGANEEELRKRKVRELREASKWTLSEKDAKKRVADLEDLRLAEVQKLKATGMSQKEAEEEAKTANVGWKPEAIKGAGKERAEAYAKTVEDTVLGTLPTSKVVSAATGTINTKYKIFNKIANAPGNALSKIVGKENVENIIRYKSSSAAETIRKGLKEKKPAEKIAEEIGKQAKEAADEGDTGGEVKPPTEGATPTGTTPSGGTAPPAGGTPPTTS